MKLFYIYIKFSHHYLVRKKKTLFSNLIFNKKDYRVDKSSNIVIKKLSHALQKKMKYYDNLYNKIDLFFRSISYFKLGDTLF